MKKLLSISGALLLLAGACFGQVYGGAGLPGVAGNPLIVSRPAGVFYAPAFFWQAKVISGNAATGSATIIVAPSGTGGSGILQLPDGTSVPLQVLGAANINLAFVPMIVDYGQAAAEYITPTAISVASCPAGNIGVGGAVQCFSVTATFANTHGQSANVVDGTYGLQTALNYAQQLGGGMVVVDPAWNSLASNTSPTNAPISPNAVMTGIVPYQAVSIQDTRTPVPQYWNTAPTAPTTLLAAGTTLTPQAACDSTHQFCSDSTVAGSASWGSTIVGCYTLVDINGNESPCSSTQSFTSVASKAIDMGVSLTARTDNVVGWKPYSSVSGGSYALAYSWPLLNQPTTLLAVPLSSGVCTLTTLETVTPACAIANSNYNQAGSTVGAGTLFKGGAQFTSYPVVTNTLAPEIGSASATEYNPNEEAHAAYAYAPGDRIGAPGIQSAHYIFPITAAAQTTVGEISATFPLPANFMNYVGRTIEVCGLIAKTSTTADTVDTIQVWWDAEGSNVTAGTPVEISSINVTEAVALAAAANFHFCQQLTTTVASTSATGGTIQPGIGWTTVSQVSAGANPSGGSSSLVAGVGSLNLALPAHLTVLFTHTTGTDGAGSKLYGATVRIIN